MTLILALAIAFIVFLIASTIILFIIGPTILLQPRRRTAEFYRQLHLPTTPSEMEMPYEEINVIARDGIRLNSWLIKSEAPARGTIVYLHGVGDCKIDGIRFAKLMHDNHFNVLLYDSRRHGHSEGKYCTYGYFEKYDVSSVIDYLQSRGDVQVGTLGVFGTSMGAAVAIQAAALDNRIAAVVAENSFATLRSIFDDYQKRMIQLPFHFLRNIVIIRSEIMAHFKASDVSPMNALQSIRIPILFVYGTADRLIKHEYSKMLHERAAAPKEVLEVAGAAHHNVWDIAGPSYQKRLLEFFGRNLT